MLLLLVILLAFSVLLKNVIDVTDALMLAGKKGFTFKYS